VRRFWNAWKKTIMGPTKLVEKFWGKGGSVIISKSLRLSSLIWEWNLDS
jgi:hypothetical protein